MLDFLKYNKNGFTKIVKKNKKNILSSLPQVDL